MTQEQVGSKMYKKYVTEEHVTLVQEPDSHYLGHVTPIAGTSRNITATIMDFFHEKNIDLEDIVVIGCDGTAVNTGIKGGIIRLIEEHLKKPLQWVVCLLHSNELPLRHLIQGIDGKTSGPAGFNGVIGKQLPFCENNCVVEYHAIESHQIDVDEEDLSTDQMYLLKIYKAVSCGECPASLSMKSPGKMAHSRWLTTASRILRLYVSTEEPSEDLIDIVSYIMKVYVPMWFLIKKNPLMINGARHMFQQIIWSRSLNERTRKIIDRVMQRNAFFSHPEHILTSMIFDDRMHIRELAWRRILEARKESRHGIRVFVVPEVKFDATEYTEMICWRSHSVTEPPVTRHFTTEEIQALISSGEKINAIKFPSHTQAVERLIKLVTDASDAVIGEDRRDGFIRTRIASRSKMAKFDTKQQFNV